MTEEQSEAVIYDMAAAHFRSGAKSILIGIMIFSGVIVLTGSAWKAVTISLCCVVFSFFNTWRRYLEPAAFLLFCVAMVYWCDTDIWQQAKSSVAALGRAG